MASSFIDKGTIIVLVILALNAGLMVGGAILNESVKGNTFVTGSLPSGLRALPSVDDTNLGTTGVSRGRELSNASADEQNWITSVITAITTATDFIVSVPSYLAAIVNFLINLLFGWIFFMNAIGAPALLTWIMAAIFVPIEVLTIGAWALAGASAILGRG